jgi:protein phosphatase methylesterase 1
VLISVPSQFTQTAEGSFVWRTNLFKSEVFWEGWFKGLSKEFLSVPVNKMLLLAGTDRLDTELTIAQMMGKFALKMLPFVGHVIQEDVSFLSLNFN